MTSRPYSKLLNFAWYQLTWFTAILGGAAVEWLLGLLVIMHLCLVPGWRRELALMLGVAALGGSLDALLATAGYFRFETAGTLPIPLWHVAIWLGFAGTLRHSMAFMVSHPRCMSAAAAVFAPLTYLAAQRLGAVTFPLGNLPTVIVISLCWLTVTPVLIWMTAIANGALPKVGRLLSPSIATQEQTS